VRLEHLSAAQARAFQLADNRLAELAVWDERLLAEQLQELAELDLDFSVELTGFLMGEIDLRIESLAAPLNRVGDAIDVPPAPAAVAIRGPVTSGRSGAIACCAAMRSSLLAMSGCCRAVPRRWCSPIRPITCPSRAMSAARAPSCTASLPWPAGR